MTTQDESAGSARRKRKRRGRKTSGRCSRVGCTQVATGSNGSLRYCSGICRSMAKELEKAESVCKSVGAPELWGAVVTLSDAVSTYVAELQRVREAARSVGLTDDQWASIIGLQPLST